MRFESRQRVNGSVAEVEAALMDDRYLPFLLQHHGVLLEAVQVEKKDQGTTVQRKVRYRPKPVIESIGPKKVPAEWFAFVETSTWDKAKKQLKFTNVPTSNKISSMLVNTGTLSLRDAGNNQTERVMEGEIGLKLPFLLKMLAPIGEAIIQREGLKILDGELPVLNRFIAEVLRAKA
ncbi:MAG: DUF2505 domain-containing protein [Myxococcaceae bacterium]|nr:DUF2505 domain-containing protein [Myxococcaceae bacterium]